SHPQADAGRARESAFFRLHPERARCPRRAPVGDRSGGRRLSDLAHGDTADCLDAAPGGRRMTSARPIVDVRGVTRVFPMQAGPVTALRGVSLCIEPSDYIAITGPSGCGKSTLLHLIGCVDTPTTGTVLFEDRDVAALT